MCQPNDYQRRYHVICWCLPTSKTKRFRSKRLSRFFIWIICFFFFLIKLYDKSFESPLLQATGEYYREEGNRCLAKLDCIQYMKKVREKEKYCVCEQKLNIFVLRFYYFSMTKNFVVENFWIQHPIRKYITNVFSDLFAIISIHWKVNVKIW